MMRWTKSGLDPFRVHCNYKEGKGAYSGAAIIVLHRVGSAASSLNAIPQVDPSKHCYRLHRPQVDKILGFVLRYLFAIRNGPSDICADRYVSCFTSLNRRAVYIFLL